MTLTPLHPSTRPVLDHARFADALAVIAGDTHLSHRDLADRVAARAQDWGPARRLVLVEGANTLDSLVAYLAAVQHGHVALVVPSGRDAQSESMVRAYDPDIVCRAGADDVRRAETTHDLHPDLALLLSTSGSTGSPKLVRLSRDNVASNAAAIADYLDLGAGDRAITALPLHYCYGLSVLHSHLVAGASIVLTELSVVDECFWDLFTTAGATSFAGVPHTFELLAASRFEERELPALRHVTQAGGRLAPESVRRWAGVGRERGWDLVVMYGQTEATARIAWLPPALADQHPASIGIAIPGGELTLDESVDERAGVGELVYTGPNVMLGYAEGPADLARGREIDELRTGDLAREVDGLFEIVGRRNRYGKVFGLRLDLDALETELRTDVGHDARVVATDRSVHVFLTTGRSGARARDGVDPSLRHPRARRTDPRRPPGAAHQHRQDRLRRPPRPGRARRPPGRTPPAARSWPTSPAPSAGPTPPRTTPSSASAVTRCPTSSSRPGCPVASPTDSRPAGTPARSASSRPWPPDCRRRLRVAGARLDTTVALRALAILFVVASHVDLVALEGGAHLLLALAGFNFARFQLSAAGDSRTRLRHGLSGVAQLVVPTVLWVGAVAVVLGTYDLTTALFLREFVNASEWDDQWQLWFLQSLVWITLAALALTCVPVLHRLERRDPFRFALVVLGVAALARFAEVGLRAGPTQRYTTLVVAFFFVLGWLGARAGTTRQRLLVSGLAVVLTVGFFGEWHREVIVLGGFLLILWRSHVTLPPLLARACGVLAGASLFIYLTHWQVYPPLEDSGHQWLALVASITVGIAYGRVVRPLNQAVGRVVRAPR